MHPTDSTDNHFQTLFSHGFRPLFLLMGVYALMGPTAWLLAWSGVVPPAGGRLLPALHGHDMVMGTGSCWADWSPCPSSARATGATTRFCRC